MPEPLQPLADPGAGRSALNGLLASFYGGIAEELQMRLFLMTLLVWLATGFGRRRPPPAVFWAAILASSLVASFVLGHTHVAMRTWAFLALALLSV